MYIVIIKLSSRTTSKNNNANIMYNVINPFKLLIYRININTLIKHHTKYLNNLVGTVATGNIISYDHLL